MSDAARVALERDDKLLRVTLARPKANVIDAAMTAAIQRALDEHRGRPALRAVLIDAEGPHFSFGASVEEHLPGNCADMLRGFHKLITTVVAYPVPVVVAVKGQCLGGGLELVSAAHVVFAAPDAKLGQPEVQLGVFAPAASVLLRERMGRAPAEELLLSGRSITAAEAAARGLVHQVNEEPATAALQWFEAHLLPKSAVAIRFATEAMRSTWVTQVERELADVEKLYLEGLMRTADAVEGLNAFLQKRAPRFEDR